MHPLRVALVVTLVVPLTACRDLTTPATANASRSLTAHVVPGGFGEGLIARFAGGRLPEGIAMDKTGNLYVGMRSTGEIVALTPEPSGGSYTQTVVATLDPGLLGLATDAEGNVYAAVASFRPATHGVWRVSREGGAERLPGTAQIFFPNALAFDAQGNLYVTTSSGPPLGAGAFAEGAIWRIPPGGSAALWLADPLLSGTNVLDPPFPIGANGIAYRASQLVVANTERGLVVRVPIEADGAPGVPSVIAGGFTFLDGLALDVHGDVYLLVIGASKLVRVTADGAVTDVAGPLQGVDFATSLVFGTGRGDRTSVFLANFAGFPSPLPDRPGPSVLKLDVGVPGDPLP